MYTVKQNKTKSNINNKNGSTRRKFTALPLALSAVWREIQMTVSTHATNLKNASTLQCRGRFLCSSGHLISYYFRHGNVIIWGSRVFYSANSAKPTIYCVASIV